MIEEESNQKRGQSVEGMVQSNHAMALRAVFFVAVYTVAFYFGIISLNFKNPKAKDPPNSCFTFKMLAITFAGVIPTTYPALLQNHPSYIAPKDAGYH